MKSTLRKHSPGLLVPLVLLMGACGDETADSAAPPGIESREQWCSVVGEVDVLFTAADTRGDTFTVRQVAYENIRQLLQQLDDGLEHVDAEARDAVAESLAFGTSVTNAFITAEDDAQAEQQLEVLFTSGEDVADSGAAWIADNCGIDIDG